MPGTESAMSRGPASGTNQVWYRFYAPRRLASMTAEQVREGRARAGGIWMPSSRAPASRPAIEFIEIGCGWGRHSLGLARRGFRRVVSVDIAPEPIGLARALAREEGLACHIRQQDFALVQDGPYAAALSLYDRSVCGFPTEGEDARASATWRACSSPGGWLVFGIDDWPADLPAASASRRTMEEGSSWSRSSRIRWPGCAPTGSR